MQNGKLQYLGSLMVTRLNVFFQDVLFVILCVRARHIPGKAVKHNGELVSVMRYTHC